MTYSEMIDLLRKGGVDVEGFDERGLKTLAQLFQEIECKDAILGLDKRTGRIVRHAYTVAVLIRVPRLRIKYLEMARRLKGKVLKRKKEWSMSETVKVGEDIPDAAARGIAEEFGLAVRPEQFAREPNFRTQIPPYESSAFPGIVSNVVLWRLKLDLWEPPWREEMRVVNDEGTLIFVRRIHY